LSYFCFAHKILLISYIQNSLKLIGKKAQITLFMILGFVILFSFGIFYMMRNTTPANNLDAQNNKIIASKDDLSNVKLFVQTCLKKAADKNTDAELGYLWIFGENGGTVKFEYDTTISKKFDTVTLFDNAIKNVSISYDINAITQVGNKIIRNQTDMEKELGEYILNDFLNCFNEESIKNRTGYLVFSPKNSAAEAKINVTFNYNNVNIALQYPMNLTKGDNFIEIKNFEVDIPLRINQTLQIRNNLLDQISSSSSSFDISNTDNCNIICDKAFPNYAKHDFIIKAENSVSSITSASNTYTIIQINDYFSNINYYKKTYKFSFALNETSLSSSDHLVTGICTCN